VAALTTLASRATGEGAVNVSLDVVTAIPTLPGAIVHDLRMIARESLNNAVKHGGATDVSIRLEARDGQLVLRVIDNGCGFDPTAAALNKRGHFGCAGIRERSRKIGAQVRWQSHREMESPTHLSRATVTTSTNGEPGPSKRSGGTTVHVELPLTKTIQKLDLAAPSGEAVPTVAAYPAKPIVL
jgi:signal transduction histidine kinase